LSHRVVLPVLGGWSGHTDRSSVGSRVYVDCRPTMTGAGRSLAVLHPVADPLPRRRENALPGAAGKLGWRGRRTIVVGLTT
jgi:hypothetical protein